MAIHSSTLVWKIPWMEDPGRLQSMGLQSLTHLNNLTSLISYNGPVTWKETNTEVKISTL